ncbi:metalloprotease PmbA [Salinisphaera hydrothermalis]|uniref:PmbA protein n=1 Tax=Salinisphaera hydrothermalis (strain C41B8) TaxID=1304275 RepID=A0A084IPA5_SALHC|nr:metalloprotease PmbA [Salinisphaera hydrothermalis]KEZ78539.1 PmbA protein [Salinisphaera hydrothermalis C41B8]
MTEPAVVSADTRELPTSDALRESLNSMLARAARAGADAAEASLSASRSLSVSVRDRARETLEYEGDRSAAVTVYRGQASGSASTTDLTPAGLAAALDQALTIARFTEPDEYAGLAEAHLMARDWPDLALYNPWSLTPDAAQDMALAVEAAALDADARIAQTEGATVATQDAISAYGNSHGFIGIERASRHAASCTAIARDSNGRMQREIAFSQARRAEELLAPAEIGRLAADRALARLGARAVPTTTAPVLFTPRVARSLWGHLFGAISGGSLYRNASFLKDRIDQRIAVPTLTLRQVPHRRHGLASTGFDDDGVATTERDLVAGGVLRSYLLSAYSARRLGLTTTGNAGGVFNVDVAPGQDDFETLVSAMGRGLVVTELMGQGVNLVNGDYSRGAAGWWVENGELAYPVENATVAGNLAEMYNGIAALGNDVEYQSALRTPSVVIDRMTIAGQ